MSFKIVNTEYFGKGPQGPQGPQGEDGPQGPQPDISELDENDDIDSNKVEVYYNKNNPGNYFTKKIQ